MDFTRLDQQLRDSLVDLKLSNEERDELRQLGSDLGPDQVRYLRNRAFDLVRDLTLSDAANALPALKWLEQVIKTLDAASAPPRPAVASAHFSPGEDCLRKIRELCRQARETVDICVYTISDDRLSEEIVACHRRGVTVRVISDNEKQHDHLQQAIEALDLRTLFAVAAPLASLTGKLAELAEQGQALRGQLLAKLSSDAFWEPAASAA